MHIYSLPGYLLTAVPHRAATSLLSDGQVESGIHRRDHDSSQDGFVAALHLTAASDAADIGASSVLAAMDHWMS